MPAIRVVYKGHLLVIQFERERVIGEPVDDCNHFLGITYCISAYMGVIVSVFDSGISELPDGLPMKTKEFLGIRYYKRGVPEICLCHRIVLPTSGPFRCLLIRPFD